MILFLIYQIINWFFDKVIEKAFEAAGGIKDLISCKDGKYFLNQTLSDIEIICVNDCSTDKSLSVLREYEAVDKRIKIIDLSSNMGVSFARNVALDIAQGEYIAFLDGDDWWECDMLEKTFNKACQEKANIVQFTHNCISGQTSFPFF